MHLEIRLSKIFYKITYKKFNKIFNDLLINILNCCWIDCNYKVGDNFLFVYMRASSLRRSYRHVLDQRTELGKYSRTHTLV